MLIEAIEQDSKIIELHFDDNPESPREWDNLGTIYCTLRDYEFGDKDAKQIDMDDKNYITLPIYAYIHSGIALSTSRYYPFNCQWDSVLAGQIYVSKEKIKNEYNCKRITQKLTEKVINQLVNEISTLDSYLQGQVFGYVVKKQIECNQGDIHNEILDSCWGFYDKNECLEEAKRAA